MQAKSPNRRLEARQKNQSKGLVTRVLRLRIKDKHANYLRSVAREVNLVWNFCQESGLKILERERRFCSSGDLHKLTVGASKELPLHSQTIQAINEEYVLRRVQFKKRKLRWRVSDPKSARYSLGWIPFKKAAIKYKNGQIHLAGVALSLWDSYGLSEYDLGSGNISEDARGRWYINITVKVAKKPLPISCLAQESIGLDLGLKDLLASSNGTKVEAQRFYRDLEDDLAKAQRAKKKRRVQAIHAKISNRRKDHLHKLSTALVRTHGAIFVGNVNSLALVKTRMAKSVLDAGWGQFKTMLQYKSDDAGRWFKEVDEAYSTQMCHCCGSISGPKGQEGLDVRQWDCPECGAQHDRDTNAAKNIQARGLKWLDEQFSIAVEAKACEVAMNEVASKESTGVGLTL